MGVVMSYKTACGASVVLNYDDTSLELTTLVISSVVTDVLRFTIDDGTNSWIIETGEEGSMAVPSGYFMTNGVGGISPDGLVFSMEIIRC